MRGRKRGRDDGASAVEFALVLPLLIILLFGIISFGIVFAQKLALGNAARQAHQRMFGCDIRAIARHAFDADNTRSDHDAAGRP